MDGTRNLIRKKWVIVVAYDEGGNNKPFLNQAVKVELPCSTSIGDFIRKVMGKFGQSSKYASPSTRIVSLSTGRGTSLGMEIIDEPLDTLALALQEGEKCHMIALLALTNSDAFSPLEDKTTKKIFSYVGDARAFLACEKSCSRFKPVLTDYNDWKLCNGSNAYGGTFRENALSHLFVRNVEKEHESIKNTILSVLSPESINDTTNQCYSENSLTLFIRGDSLGYAMDIIEDDVVSKLEQALLVSIRASKETNMYPVVTVDDLGLVHSIRGVSASRAAWTDTVCRRHLQVEIQNGIDKNFQKRSNSSLRDDWQSELEL